jgi:hypothetical protein
MTSAGARRTGRGRGGRGTAGVEVVAVRRVDREVDVEVESSSSPVGVRVRWGRGSVAMGAASREGAPKTSPTTSASMRSAGATRAEGWEASARSMCDAAFVGDSKGAKVVRMGTEEVDEEREEVERDRWRPGVTRDKDGPPIASDSAWGSSVSV